MSLLKIQGMEDAMGNHLEAAKADYSEASRKLEEARRDLDATRPMRQDRLERWSALFAFRNEKAGKLADVARRSALRY